MGGKSKGIYKSLNCGLGSYDVPKSINNNLKIVIKKIKTKSKKIFLLKQSHSNKFNYIDKKFKFRNNVFNGDALITNRANTPIAVLTADCAPILVYDKNKKMVAAIHAGWKGAYKDIVHNVVKFMIKKGCTPKNMIAAIGPCISSRSYEIKKDFKNKFLKNDKKNKVFFKKKQKKIYFSLNKYISYQLKSLDIKKIDIINKDTYIVKNNFFSARRSISRNEADYGRNISIIVIN